MKKQRILNQMKSCGGYSSFDLARKVAERRTIKNRELHEVVTFEGMHHVISCRDARKLNN